MGITPEGRVKKLVNTALGNLRSPYYKFMPVQTGYGSTSLDFIICINGWFIAIETKKDRNAKLTPRQQSTKADMEAAGGLVFVISDEPSCDRAFKIIEGICINGVRETSGPERQAQAEGQIEQHQGPEQQGKTVAEATGGDHGAPRKKSRRPAKPRTSGDDHRVTATVRYFCPAGCIPVDHPAMLRSIPWCEYHGVPMRRNPMTNGN